MVRNGVRNIFIEGVLDAQVQERTCFTAQRVCWKELCKHEADVIPTNKAYV